MPAAARRRRYPSDTSVAEWALLEPLLPVPACQTKTGGHPEKWPRREIVDGIRYIVDNGAKWRALPADFPPWETVYGFFWRWNRAGVVTYIRDQLRRRIRTGKGRCPHPVTLIVDSQSVKGASTVGKDSRGYDAAKKINGRKRHITVDTLGLPVMITVTPADVQDRDAARDVFWRLRLTQPQITQVWADRGYAGDLVDWARDRLWLSLRIVSRPKGTKGFVVLPRRTVVADDRMKANDAYRQACEGTALLWQGDFHNARQLLRAMGRRIDRTPPRSSTSPSEKFHLHRRSSSHRARVLGKLLVLLDGDYTLTLRRAPDVRQACLEAYGPSKGPMAVSLRELLGVIGAHQWRLKGIDVPALGARIHPHYGVFAPVRGEYVDLVTHTPLPSGTRHSPAISTAFDLGTGTGVLAAVLAHRGIQHVVATDISPRALACAKENVHRLALTDRIEVSGPGLFPEGRADLIVCNPPWLPARPTGPIEQGVYDPDSTMLHSFLAGLSAHLRPGGEGWLILSNLAEHLGLRTRQQLLDAIQAAQLRVVDKIDTKPRHPRSKDAADPLHRARSAEITSLWRLTT